MDGVATARGTLCDIHTGDGGTRANVCPVNDKVEEPYNTACATISSARREAEQARHNALIVMRRENTVLKEERDRFQKDSERFRAELKQTLSIREGLGQERAALSKVNEHLKQRINELESQAVYAPGYVDASTVPRARLLATPRRTASPGNNCKSAGTMTPSSSVAQRGNRFQQASERELGGSPLKTILNGEITPAPTDSDASRRRAMVALRRENAALRAENERFRLANAKGRSPNRGRAVHPWSSRDRQLEDANHLNKQLEQDVDELRRRLLHEELKHSSGCDTPSSASTITLSPSDWRNQCVRIVPPAPGLSSEDAVQVAFQCGLAEAAEERQLLRKEVEKVQSEFHASDNTPCEYLEAEVTSLKAALAAQSSAVLLANQEAEAVAAGMAFAVARSENAASQKAQELAKEQQITQEIKAQFAELETAWGGKLAEAEAKIAHLEECTAVSANAAGQILADAPLGAQESSAFEENDQEVSWSSAVARCEVAERDRNVLMHHYEQQSAVLRRLENCCLGQQICNAQGLSTVCAQYATAFDLPSVAHGPSEFRTEQHGLTD